METSERIEAMATKMATQLRVRGDTLAEITGNAGRKLPRHLRREAESLIQAEAMLRHPKLWRLVDDRQVRRAEKRLNKFLDKKNPAAERRGEILDRIAGVAFVLVVSVLSVFFYLLSTGYFD